MKRVTFTVGLHVQVPYGDAVDCTKEGRMRRERERGRERLRKEGCVAREMHESNAEARGASAMERSLTSVMASEAGDWTLLPSIGP